LQPLLSHAGLNGVNWSAGSLKTWVPDFGKSSATAVATAASNIDKIAKIRTEDIEFSDMLVVRLPDATGTVLSATCNDNGTRLLAHTRKRLAAQSGDLSLHQRFKYA